MALPVGLLPVFWFVLTVGLSVPIAVAAHQFRRAGTTSMSSALRIAFSEAGLLYLVGVGVIWTITGGGSLWATIATLVVPGIVAGIVLMVLPLLVGRAVIQRSTGIDSDRALQHATYGWPVAMVAVFGIFIAPGGLTAGHLFDLGGQPICLAGHCGIPTWLAVAALLELVVAVLGPGFVGLLIASQMGRSSESVGQ